MRLCLALIISLLAWDARPALSEIVPVATSGDERIKRLIYRDNDVVVLELTYGISTMITFGENEAVETVSTGDSEGIAAEPSKDQSVLFVKPIAQSIQTNLSVTTNLRNYVFFVTAAELNGQTPTLKIEIVYPTDEEARRLQLEIDRRRAAVRAEAERRVGDPNISQLSKEDVNLDYGFKGSPVSKPTLVFDDGVKTFFQFQGEVPAIFSVDRRRNEQLVNYRREGDYIVVDAVRTQWTLRNGPEDTCLFNLAVPDPGTGAESPLGPKDLNRRGFRGLFARAS